MAAFRQSCELSCRLVRDNSSTDAQFRALSLFMRCPRNFSKNERTTSVLLPILFDDLQDELLTVDQQLRSIGKLECGTVAPNMYANMIGELQQQPLCIDRVRNTMCRVRVLPNQLKLTERVLTGANRLVKMALDNPYSRKTCTHDEHCNCFIRDSVQSAKAGWLLLYALPGAPAVFPANCSAPSYQSFVNRLKNANAWVLLPAVDSDAESLDSSTSASFSSEPKITGSDGLVVLAVYRASYTPEPFRELLQSIAPALHFCYAQPLRILLPQIRRKRFMERVIRHARGLRSQLDDKTLYMLLTAHGNPVERLHYALSRLVRLPLTSLAASNEFGYRVAALTAYMQLIDDMHRFSSEKSADTSLCNVWLELTQFDPFVEISIAQ